MEGAVRKRDPRGRMLATIMRFYPKGETSKSSTVTYLPLSPTSKPPNDCMQTVAMREFPEFGLYPWIFTLQMMTMIGRRLEQLCTTRNVHRFEPEDKISSYAKVGNTAFNISTLDEVDMIMLDSPMKPIATDKGRIPVPWSGRITGSTRGITVSGRYERAEITQGRWR